LFLLEHFNKVVVFQIKTLYLGPALKIALVQAV